MTPTRTQVLCISNGLSLRAEDGARTRNIQIGSLVLYQLSYFCIYFEPSLGVEPSSIPYQGIILSY
jgi:hypothetical protein